MTDGDVKPADLADQINQRLARLDQDLAALRNDWTGTATESYDAARLAWDSAMRDMAQLIDELHSASGIGQRRHPHWG